MASRESEANDRQSPPRITMAQSQLKRTTCDICRERKVRCDREKPQCQRCRRSGQKCTYPSASKDIAEINSALHHLHSRLMQAEMKLQEHGVQITATETAESNSNSDSNSTFGMPNTQLVYDLLPSGGDIDFSDITFSEFEPSTYHHQPIDVDAMNGPAPDQTQQDLELEMNRGRSGFSSISDAVVVQAHVSPDMWFSDSAMTGPPLDSVAPQRIEQINSIAGIERLYQPYFELVQKHMPLVDQQNFMQAVVCRETHQCRALKYAVAMSGANACGEPALALESYSAARFHLERAESLVDNSSFLNLESVQALILIARFESTQVSAPKGLMTTARLMQLVSLLGYDVLDHSAAEEEQDGFQTIVLPATAPPANLREMRQTYWTAFAMHCNAVADFPCCTPIREESIRTPLSITTRSIGNSPHPSHSSPSQPQFQPIYLTSQITKPIASTLSIHSLFILSMKLVAQADQHHQKTKQFISATENSPSDYNFCIAHERIERQITTILHSLSTPGFLDSPDVELRVLTFVITLGVRIALFRTAVVASQKADFLGPVAVECRKNGLAAANAMCDLLLQADVLNPKMLPTYIPSSNFLLRPLSLAASIQLDFLQSNVLEPNSTIFSTHREIRQNLQTICSVMTACKPSTGEWDERINEGVRFLERTKMAGLGMSWT